MSANMGGTEIYNPLSFIFESQAIIPGIPRNIFLITDGGVTDTDSVLELIKRNAEYISIYTLGIDLYRYITYIYKDECSILEYLN